MSTQPLRTTQDPTKYWRPGVALTLANKVIFEQRLEQLGLQSAGDLLTAFVLADGIVEAMKPVIDRYQENGGKRAHRTKVKDVAGQLQGLSQEQLDKLLTLAKAA